MTREQAQLIGIASRRLLAAAWALEPPDEQLVRHGIQCVARTYTSDPTASRNLLGRALDADHLASLGHQEVFTLASALPKIMPHDAAFVRDAYAAVFGFEERSDQVSPMGRSQILRMTSTRRQDYEGAQYVLSRNFRAFLEHSAGLATEALVASIASYIHHRHQHLFERYEGGTFAFLGESASMMPDGSALWDESTVYQRDSAIEMARTLCAWLAERIGQQDGRATESLQVIGRMNTTAFLWRRLLDLGTRQPATVGVAIRELAWAAPLMRALDTTYQNAGLITAIYPRCDQADRVRIERAILSLADGVGGREGEAILQRRDQLVALLPLEMVVSDEARSLREEAVTRNVPEIERPFRMDVGGFTDEGPEGWIARAGANIDDPANRRVLELTRVLADGQLTNRVFDDPDRFAREVRGPIDALHRVLTSPDSPSIDPPVARNAWGALASTAVRTLGFENCPAWAAHDLRGLVLEISENADPSPDPVIDRQFDDMPAWGSPAPRLEATQGVMLLGRFPEALDVEVRAAIDRLSLDAVPSVRLQVADRLWLLHKSEPGTMWAIAERMATSDPSAGVVGFLVNDTLGRIATLDPDRIVGLLQTILNRFLEGPGVSELRQRCIDILSGWYVWRNLARAGQVLLAIADARPLSTMDASSVCADLRDVLVAFTDEKRPDGDGARKRAVDLFGRLVKVATSEFRELEAKARATKEPLSEPDNERASQLAAFIDHAAREVYFASGVFHERNDPNDEVQVAPVQRERLLSEAAVLMGDLADTGIAPVAHHLLEVLEASIDFAPQQAFLLIGRTLIAGERGRYQFESLAEPLFVRIVERYLSDFRALFQEDPLLRSMLLEILDIFVKAGWPSAQRLSYRLDEVFR